MAQKTSPGNEISSLDIRFLLKEWEFLAGAFIRKIYQAGEKDNYRIAFELFIPKRGTNYLHVSPSHITLDKNKGPIKREGGTEERRRLSAFQPRSAFRPGSETPSGFCMFLRKHLSDKKILKIGQHGFDRIMEISAGGLGLILEFVPPGNVILIDSEGIILSALRTRRWRDREIRPRAKYAYPPERPDPFSMNLEQFRKFFLSEKKAVVVLASELGLGSAYANKLCSLSGVRPDKAAKGLEEREVYRLLAKLPDLGRIESKERFIEFTDREKERLEHIERQRAEAKEKWKAAEKLSKERADAIYRKFDTVEALLQKFSGRKDTGFEPVVKREGLHITVKLDGVDVQLDLKKSAQDNAAFYYEQAKKARRKVASLESLGKPAEINRGEEPVEYPDNETHKEWHKKFKWFRSSDGILVVAGKNADQNELLLKSRAEPDEWCFHADIRGAAFTVIKSGSQEPPEKTKKEAAEFAAANSKAWTKGMGSVHVFSVQRKSLSKTPPTGMHLEKGSFMVYGQRVWYRNIPLRMAVTAGPDGGIFSSPESAVNKQAYSVMLVPGTKKASDLSREMKSELLKMAKPKDLPAMQKLPLDELARHVPFGFGEIARK